MTYNHSSPLVGKYLIKNRFLRATLIFIDWSFLFFFRFFPHSPKKKKSEPTAILLANGGHLGDALIFSSIFSIVRKAFPKAKIGVLIGSWSQEIIRTNPLVDHIHLVDHWRLNRAKISMWKKFWQYLRSRSVAMKEIKSLNYDIAIDTYYYFPNSIFLLWQTGIPVRLAYTSGGFSPFLTHRIDWENKDWPVAYYHLDLLRILGVPEALLRNIKIEIPDKVLYSGKMEFLKKLKPLGINEKEYIICHIGTGTAIKEWPLDKWKILASKLVSEKNILVFTGYGVEEKTQIDEVIVDLPECISFCNVLTLESFIGAVSASKLVISVDSLAGHIAAATNTPCITIGNGINNINHWKPMGDPNWYLVASVPCLPCYRSQGCFLMSCVRDIPVEEVVRLVF